MWIMFFVDLMPTVAFRFHVDEDIICLIGPHKNVENLFSRPESDGLPYSRGWDVDLEIRICKITAYLCELTSVEEPVFLGKEEGGCDKVLYCRDDRFSVPRRHEIVFDAHKFKCLCSRLFRLRYI